MGGGGCCADFKEPLVYSLGSYIAVVRSRSREEAAGMARFCYRRGEIWGGEGSVEPFACTARAVASDEARRVTARAEADQKAERWPVLGVQGSLVVQWSGQNYGCLTSLVTVTAWTGLGLLGCEGRQARCDGDGDGDIWCLVQARQP